MAPETVERVAQALYEIAQHENGNLSALPWRIARTGETSARWRTYAQVALEASAQPDLLEALQDLEGAASNFSVSGVYFDEPCMTHEQAALAKARAAIAKATSN